MRNNKQELQAHLAQSGTSLALISVLWAVGSLHPLQQVKCFVSQVDELGAMLLVRLEHVLLHK